jgi:hypothetical protein
MTDLTKKERSALRVRYRGLFKTHGWRPADDPARVDAETQMAALREALGEAHEFILDLQACREAGKKASHAAEAAAKNPLGLDQQELTKRRNRRDKAAARVRKLEQQGITGAELELARDKLAKRVRELGYDPDDRGATFTVDTKAGNAAKWYAEQEEREADEIMASLSKDRKHRMFSGWNLKTREWRRLLDEREYLRSLGLSPLPLYYRGVWLIPLPGGEIDTVGDVMTLVDEDGDNATPVPESVIVTAADRRDLYWGHEATPEQINRRRKSRKGMSRMERTREWWQLRYRRYIRSELRLVHSGAATPELMKLMAAHRPPAEIDEGLLLDIAKQNGWLMRHNPPGETGKTITVERELL